VVEIEHHDSKWTVFAASGVKFAIKKLLHVAAVVKAGERIADGLEPEIFAELKVSDGESDVFGDGNSELTATIKSDGVGVRLLVGNDG
jgi:hypothetical protein